MGQRPGMEEEKSAKNKIGGKISGKRLREFRVANFPEEIQYAPVGMAACRHSM